MASHRTQFPAAALDWLVNGQHGQQLLVIGSAAVSVRLAAAGHRVIFVDKDVEVLRHTLQTVPEESGPSLITAQAEALPFRPCLFDFVIAHQVFNRFAPGMALSEIARVLRPGGSIAVSYLVRDDTVPWVGRLADLVQSINPQAMQQNFGVESVENLLISKYFPKVEYRDFRVWVPVSRDQMLEMAARTAAHASENDRKRLLANVGSLYDEYSPGSEGLKLPYQMRCWRAWVDHEELTASIEVDDTGLVIPI